jgi:hypothetical protein
MAGDSRYLHAILARARGIREDDPDAIRASVAVLDGCAARYQAARSRYLLGGSERDRALEVFAELRAVPADED